MWHCPRAGWQQIRTRRQSAFPSGEETITARSRCNKAALPTQGYVDMAQTTQIRRIFCAGRIHKDHWVQHRTNAQDTPKSHTVCPRAGSELFLNSVRLCTVTAFLGIPCQYPATLWVENLVQISSPNLPRQTQPQAIPSGPVLVTTDTWWHFLGEPHPTAAPVNVC